VHWDAVERLRKLVPEDVDRSIQSFSGTPTTVGEILWDFILLHNVHHRGQLVLLSRQAGGRPTGLFGPTRETMPLPKREA
jgi:uncharacterized damage-inducible protein DinB